MTEEIPALVFDTSVLYHAALAERLDVLGSLVARRRCVTTRVVLEELARRGVEQDEPRLRAVSDEPWLDEVRVDGHAEIQHLLTWMDRLGAGDRDLGEATVLGFTAASGAVAVIDDDRARRRGRQAGLRVHGTLWLLADACRGELIAPGAAAGYVDAVRATGARLPCRGADFPNWARRHGLSVKPDRWVDGLAAMDEWTEEAGPVPLADLADARARLRAADHGLDTGPRG